MALRRCFDESLICVDPMEGWRKELIDHPAFVESVYKDIPRLPVSVLSMVSSRFGIAEVVDFNPSGDSSEKNIPWATISRAVLARDNYMCRLCGKTSLSPIDNSKNYNRVHFEVEVHHIVPRKNKGSDSFRNLVTLCEECHHRTFSNNYAGVPVSVRRDLFSYERRIEFVFPPDNNSSYEGDKKIGFVLDHERIFDPDEHLYRVMPLSGAKLKVSLASLTIDQYRDVLSEIIRYNSVKDYATLTANVSGKETAVRVLIDADDTPLI